MLYDEYADAVAKYKKLYGERVLVVFEVGSFYEWYNCDQNAGCDVQGVCELLNIMKTRKDKSIPKVSRKNPEFGGVPNHSFPKFVPVLLENGYTIVLFTQRLSSDNKIVRALSDVISRGTCLDPGASTPSAGRTAYDGGRGNFVACVFVDSHTHVDPISRRPTRVPHCGCSFLDVTSGVSFSYEVNSAPDDVFFAVDELHRLIHEFCPSELVMYGHRAALAVGAHAFVDDAKVKEKEGEGDVDADDDEAFPETNDKKKEKKGEDDARRLRRRSGRLADFLLRITVDAVGVYDRLDGPESARVGAVRFQESILRRVFPERETGFLSAIEALDLENKPHACASFAGLLQFVFEHNEHVLQNIRRPVVSAASDGDYDESTNAASSPAAADRRALLNYNAAEQLDIFSSSSLAANASATATLYNVLNACVTNMGKRYLKHQLLHPLVDAAHINRRLDHVQRYLVSADETPPQQTFVSTDECDGAARACASDLLYDVRSRLRKVGDLERLFRRVALRRFEAPEFAALDAALDAVITAPGSDRRPGPFSESSALRGDRDCVAADDVLPEDEAADLQPLERCRRLAEVVRTSYTGVIDVPFPSGGRTERNTSKGDDKDDDEDGVASLSNEKAASAACSKRVFDASDGVFCRGVLPDVDAMRDALCEKRRQFEKIVDAFNASQGRNFFRIENVNVNSGSGAPKISDATSVFVNSEDADTSSATVSSSSTYMVVATHKRCDALRAQHAGRTKILWHGTDYEFDFSKLGVRHVNSSTSCVTHPLLSRLDNEIRDGERRVRVSVETKYNAFLKAMWEEHGDAMTELAKQACYLDYITTCAHNAVRYCHRRPRVLSSGPKRTDADDDPQLRRSRSHIALRRLRHPILEVINDRVPHVPNDVAVGVPGSRGALVYGMNAAGKSCLMKAVALAAVMAQAGMFVPCADAEVAPFRKFFTRIQSKDDLARGQSTFMVEMSELRNILKRCDDTSLVIGDEICSGTESVSALSIVGTSVRRLLDKRVAFLFATHLHELPRALSYIRTDVADLRTCHLRVQYDARSGNLVYDRRLCDGQGPTVYGLEVCRALDMDPAFVDTAHVVRKCLLAHPNDGVEAADRVEKTTRLGAVSSSRYNARTLVSVCGACGSAHAEEVHHIRHQREADDQGIIDGSFHKNAAFNLVPLCRACHRAVHDGKLRIRGYVQTSEGVALDLERN